MTHKKINRFEDMTVWQDSQELAVSIYNVTKSFPKDELYSLTNQIRRSASSVSANIAEGFGRGTNKDKSHFYRIALGSLFETKNFIYLCSRLGYTDDITTDKTVKDIDGIHKQITAILRYFDNES
ncbi:four helix bundle protein [Candidatus Saccharibacteria bacterium]|nr:four helix bundle protein [Candidatus Saccharibacteria bacterium]